MFITFEGIDGCGKTTQIRLLSEYLQKNDKEVLSIREPGGTEFSEEIREILLHSKHNLNSISELMLFEAARADLTEKIIKPALEQGKFVLSDRFFDSTTAYQGYGRGLNLENVQNINLFATNNLKPDITFYLRINLDTSDNRTNHRKLDKIESSGSEFFKKLINGFDEIANQNPDRIIIIDAENSIEKISNEIISVIDNKLKFHHKL